MLKSMLFVFVSVVIVVGCAGEAPAPLGDAGADVGACGPAPATSLPVACNVEAGRWFFTCETNEDCKRIDDRYLGCSAAKECRTW